MFQDSPKTASKLSCINTCCYTCSWELLLNFYWLDTRLLRLIDLETTTDDVLTFITAARIHTSECKEDKVENKLIYLRLLLRRTHSFGHGAALLPALATPDNSKREGLLSQRFMSSYYATNMLSWYHGNAGGSNYWNTLKTNVKVVLKKRFKVQQDNRSPTWDGYRCHMLTSVHAWLAEWPDSERRWREWILLLLLWWSDSASWHHQRLPLSPVLQTSMCAFPRKIPF